MSLYLWLATLPPSARAAWPVDEAHWVPFELSGSVLADGEFDVGAAARTDLVGDAKGSAAYWYADQEALHLRMRVGGDPMDVLPLTYDDTWGFLLETDGDDTQVELALLLTNNGTTLTLRENTDAGPGVTDDVETELVGYSLAITTGVARVADAPTTWSGDADYFVDLLIPLVSLSKAKVVPTTSLRIVTGTTYGDFAAESLLTDRAGVDDEALGTPPDLADVLSDAVVMDEDEDGLNRGTEDALGTLPDDADTDDDGLSDGAEATLGTDPLVCDTDGDGLWDGLEAGVTALIDGTDAGAGCFTFDTDGTSTTDPLQVDTDGGGLSDATEDKNANGRIDDWETDPTNPKDDLDLDADGIPDTLEGVCASKASAESDADGDSIPDAVEVESGFRDSDGDGTPDFCDDDDDDDGIPTESESAVDTDGDTTPDYLDDDSDADGASDEDEGTGDEDCDDFQNYVDDDALDGPCADADGDGLTNEEEEDCGTDPTDPDSDDDGQLDSEEDCDGGDEGGADDGGDDGSDDTGGWPEDQTYGLTEGSFTGGACATLPIPTGLLAVAGVMIGLLRRRRAWILAAIPGAASAQELDAQRFSPSIDGRAFVVVQDTALPSEGVGGGLLANYADDPLVFRYDDPTRDEVEMLGHVLTMDLLGFWSMEPLRVGLDLPLHVASGGPDLSGFRQVGDLSLDAMVSVSDRATAPLGLAFTGRLALPTGSEVNFLGDDGPVGIGMVGLTTGRRIIGALNLGLEVAPRQDLPDDETAWGTRLRFSGGVSVPASDALWASLEIDGERLVQTSDAPGSTPIEALATGRWIPTGDIVVSLGGGGGITTGIGAPDLRIVTGISFVPGASEAASLALSGSAREPDADGDGVADATDRCTGQAEDQNGVADDDGCPDAGATPTTLRVQDGSGALVSGATVEIEAGPETGSWTSPTGEIVRSFKPGTYTVRATAPGYVTSDEALVVPSAPSHQASLRLYQHEASGTVTLHLADSEGAPLQGTVRVLGDPPETFFVPADGVLRQDLPAGVHELVLSSPGHGAQRRTVTVTPGGTSSIDAVLRSGRVEVKGDRILLLDKVYFEVDSAVIEKASFELLDEVVAQMLEHPEMALVEIQGHTDDQGDDAYNLELSQRRAEAVLMYLTQVGVESTRLVARGYGELRPLQAGASEQVRTTNRRVEFHVLRKEGPPPAPR